MTFLTTLPISTTEQLDRGHIRHVDAHRLVMSILPDDLGPQARQAARALFRHDRSLNRLLIQTRFPPDPAAVEKRAGQTKPMPPLIFEDGAQIRYRCDVAAIRRTGSSERRVPRSEVEDWFIALSARNGFCPDNDAVGHLLDTWDAAGGAASAQHRLRIASFGGTARITEHTKLATAHTEGMGRAKAYGCGLLSVMPI